MTTEMHANKLHLFETLFLYVPKILTRTKECKMHKQRKKPTTLSDQAETVSYYFVRYLSKAFSKSRAELTDPQSSI